MKMEIPVKCFDENEDSDDEMSFEPIEEAFLVKDKGHSANQVFEVVEFLVNEGDVIGPGDVLVLFNLFLKLKKKKESTR